MNPRKLSDRVRIDQNTTTADPVYGTPVVSWVELATLWAEVQDVLPSRSENQAQGIRVANRPARIRVRWNAILEGMDISAMRVVVLGRARTMKIVSPPAILGQGEFLEFMAEEFTTSGEA